MPIQDFAVPTAFNTLDDEPFDDGHPLSSWACRELIHNDRGLHAWLCQSLMSKGWDLDNPYTYKGFGWIRLAVFSGPISPGRKTVTVRFRGIVSNGLPFHFAVNTQFGGSEHDQANHGGWTTITGSGAVADWEVTGVPVRGGTFETIEVFATGGIGNSDEGDVTGALTRVTHQYLESAAAFGGGMGNGWVIRIEEAGTGDPLSQWRTISSLVSTSRLAVFPGFDSWRDIAPEQYESGAVNFRARDVSQLQLYCVHIDEDELSGELGA